MDRPCTAGVGCGADICNFFVFNPKDTALLMKEPTEHLAGVIHGTNGVLMSCKGYTTPNNQLDTNDTL